MNKKASAFLITAILAATMALQGCGAADSAPAVPNSSGSTAPQSTSSMEESAMNTNPTAENADTGALTAVFPTAQEVKLEDGFSAVLHYGDYGFDTFLEQGGASSDAQAVEFLSRELLSGAAGLSLVPGGFGCSTLSVKSAEGDAIFGRNFDWQECDALVVNAMPENSYASISTVNMDFIRQGAGVVAGLALLSPEIRTMVALYAPLDGMNEKGFCISVNMIEDNAVIEQNTDKPDLTTTTAIRLLLDKAANVDGALALLAQYDMHSSMGMIVHFAMADAAGRSVVVEYVNNEMIVAETPVVTNFYLANGEKNGVGSNQSHLRYDSLMQQRESTPAMSMEQVRDAMNSVSKDNYDEFASTEWSIVYNQNSGEVHYYHRENYENGYIFKLGRE